MNATMMKFPLLLSSVVRHADLCHGDTEIVTQLPEGGTHRYNYRNLHRRARQLASCLGRLGIDPGERVGTLAWNSHRHLEIYFAVSGIGAICHTINPRLSFDQIKYIINHAEDRCLFFDASFAGLVEQLASFCPSVRHWIALSGELPDTSRAGAGALYEQLIETGDHDFAWPALDENSACSLCYTSGTTGNPRGVLYSHRSSILHAYAISLPDTMCISASDCILPAVPMFHVNAWGIPFAAPMMGAKLALPGPHLDGAHLYDFLESEKVSLFAGVPTVLRGLLGHLDDNRCRMSSVKRVIVGGSRCPKSLVSEVIERHGLDLRQGWGMTEMSPLGTMNQLKRKHATLSLEDTLAIRANQGRPVFGVEIRIVDHEGLDLPWDGKATGELMVRGPWVTRGYFSSNDDAEMHDWLATGDMASISHDGYVDIVDRKKDLIKSGGEWISPAEIERIVIDHPGVVDAAVIAISDPQWDERPLLLVVGRVDQLPTEDELRAHMADKIPRWWLPDEILFVQSLPYSATGKMDKLRLRKAYRNFRVDRQTAAY
jgi:fatty-acyl-CoA synthase